MVFQKLPFSTVFPVGFVLSSGPAAVRCLGGDIGDGLFLGVVPLCGCQVPHQLIEEGEGSGAAVLLIVIVAVGGIAQGAGEVAQQAFHALSPFKGGHHFIGQTFQFFVAEAHFFDHIGYRADVQLSGAFQAEALVVAALPVIVQPGDEHHGNIFFASAAKGRFHRCVHSSMGCMVY